MGEDAADRVVARCFEESVVQTVLKGDSVWFPAPFELVFRSWDLFGNEILLGMEKGSSMAPCLPFPFVVLLCVSGLLAFVAASGDVHPCTNVVMVIGVNRPFS